MFTVSGGPDHGRNCRMCRHSGADVRIQPCGCEIHARCVPLTSIVSEIGLQMNETIPVPPDSLMCPACRAMSVSKIYLFPLETFDLDKAVELRKQTLREKQEKSAGSSGPGAELAFQYLETQAETSYLMLSHNQGSGTMASDHEYQRTGRWTDEETTFSDFLIDAFDNGKIPVEHGMKLNEFLADVLLCKSSRLTKKMKNARLSVRAYKFVFPAPRLDVELLSSLGKKFLESIASDPSRLELRFNLSRLWRSHFSNLCLQVGSALLEADDWIASLEAMERRAAETEERLRKARRRRMGLALKTDTNNEETGVLFSGVPVHRPSKKLKADEKSPFPVPFSTGSSNGPSDTSVRIRSITECSDSSDSESEFISNMLDLGSHQKMCNDADDYSKIFDDFVGITSVSVPGLVRKNCGPFLDELVHYIESKNFPFQHVDVWVPSFQPMAGNSQSEVRLYHAGYGTCHHTDSPLVLRLDEYGDYSTRFSFPSGVGLPGRVFSSRQPCWERHLHEADPKVFERAGGAKVYGVKTGFGFPLRTRVIGLIVVAMYSVEDVEENSVIANTCMADLAKLAPEPKWKLVVEMGDAPEPGTTKPAGSIPESLGAALPCQSTSESDPAEDVEHQIASMLGEFMPLPDIPAAGEPTFSSAAAHSSLVPLFMSLRLLLLRDPGRRSDDENDLIGVIKKSFLGYSKDVNRGKRDIAYLVVKDWQFLKESMGPDAKKSAAKQNNRIDQYKSHQMEMPSVSTLSSKGGPIFMPKGLPHVESRMSRRSNSASVTSSHRSYAISSDARGESGKGVNIVENMP